MENDIISPRSLYKDHLLIATSVIVKRSNIHRWGVFAREKIRKYEIIEESPYFTVSMDEINLTPTCSAYSYEFEDDVIIGMGHCGLYNHSKDANVEYEVDKVNQVMRHYAIRDIDIGEELTLDYGEENSSYFTE